MAGYADLLDRRTFHRLFTLGRTLEGADSELALYRTRDRAWKFWEQAEIVLRRPRTPPVSVTPGPDSLERSTVRGPGLPGKILENPGRVKEFMDEMRPQVTRSANWVGAA